MTSRTLIKCDGPGCTREIDSNIHAGTWFTLTSGQVFGVGIGDQHKLDSDKHFCGYYCIYHYIHPHIARTISLVEIYEDTSYK